MDPPAVAISPLSTFPVSSEVPPPSPSNQNTIHVPIEIVEEILYYLLSEESTLNNCALVCKYWTPSCRRHIFHQVDFTEPSDFALWCRSIPATPNGPHAYTRKITITNDYFEDGYPQSRNKFALFLRHLTFFSNVQELAIACTPSLRTFDHIFTSSIFSHLSDVVRSLSIRNGYCSPQTLVLLVTPFRCLEHLELAWMRFEPSELLRTLPERPTFKGKGTFYMVDLDSSEQFATLFAEQDLRFREMYVSGEYWLRDTGWNKCLAKCADHLEKFRICWTESMRVQTDWKYKSLAFKSLRELSIHAFLVLPPPELFSSITSTRLAEVAINIITFPPGKELDKAVDVIRGYDEALWRLSNQLERSDGSEKLVLSPRVRGGLPDPNVILPRFSTTGVVKVMT